MRRIVQLSLLLVLWPFLLPMSLVAASVAGIGTACGAFIHCYGRTRDEWSDEWSADR